MTLFAVWPYFLLVFVVSIACGLLPPFKLVDDARAAAGMRTETLDGLRGFLALSVFVHHFVITHRYLQSGIWDYPPSAFYTLLGQVGFGGFFMITGFLFWGKLLDARGRPDWWTLYLGRVFRIGPMYVVVVVLMLFVGSWNAARYPIILGYDAQEHMSYADLLIHQGRTPTVADGGEYYAPPGYYAVAGAATPSTTTPPR